MSNFNFFQATLRYKEILGPHSSEVADVEALIRRWVSFYSMYFVTICSGTFTILN